MQITRNFRQIYVCDDLLGAGPVTFCPTAGAVTLPSPKTAPKQNKTKMNIVTFSVTRRKRKFSTFEACVPLELSASMRDPECFCYEDDVSMTTDFKNGHDGRDYGLYCS